MMYCSLKRPSRVWKASEKGQVTELGAVNVMTGIYTGRSPKDTLFVMDETSKNTVWWTSEEYKNDNKPVDEKCWKACKELATTQLSNKRLFVVDAFCGTNPNSLEAALHHGGGMAGSFRDEYVHPSDCWRIGIFRWTRLRNHECL